MRIEYHRTLISDHVRNRVLYEALKASIVPGETVVADIGAGTGLLGLMAAKLGAREVFLYETAEVGGVAEAIIAQSGVTNCYLMPCHSTEMEEPPQVDVIISETLGNYAFEEDIITTLSDARERFLRPGGIVLPSAVRQYAAPVVGRRLHDELGVWARTGDTYGLDLSLAQSMSFNNVYVRRIGSDELWADAAVEWDHVDFSTAADPVRTGHASWSASAPVTVYGFAVWWDACFGPDLKISTGPEAPETHWEQLYFPLELPIALQREATVRLDLVSQSSPDAGTHLSWSGTELSAQGEVVGRQDMDLDKGYLP